MRRYLALALSLLMVSGCSTMSYSGRPVPVPKIEAMPVWRTEGPVTVGVDPYVQQDRQREFFDADLRKVSVLPIYLLIKNNGDRPLRLRRADTNLDITLEPLIGQKTWLMNPEAVLQLLYPHTSGRGDSFDISAQDLGGVITLFLLPLIIAGTKGAESAAAARLADYKEKEFKNVKLNKDESTHGFVFFYRPLSGPYHEKGKIVLHFVDETDGSAFTVRVPMM
jgi:hypothetical protein